MSSGRPPVTGYAPVTVSPATARQQILERAKEAAQAHTGLKSESEGKLSSDWKDFFDDKRLVRVDERACTFNVYVAGDQGPVVFCIHGGGYTGLSFALVAETLKSEYRVVAMDMRHHGETQSDGDGPRDFSKDTLAADVTAVWNTMFGADNTPTVLVGHSVGGAIAVWAALRRDMGGLEGLIVIDVVEAALPRMTLILNKRPKAFADYGEAINWMLSEEMCHHRRAATISMPSQLVRDGEQLRWRTPMMESEPFWEGWYLGLSEAFLQVPVPKLLMLAGADRLDRPLTIAQMQGKFQMVLVPNAGHAVQEDEPAETASTIRNFVKRFRVGQPPLSFPKSTLGLTPTHEPACS